VAGLTLNEILKAWGVAGKAMALMLCVLVAAQSVGAFAASAKGPRSCHGGHGTAATQPAHAAGHDHASHEHASGNRHAHSAEDTRWGHDEQPSHAEDEGRSHSGVGCCGWLCSAATLPPSSLIRPAYVSGVTVALPLVGAPETARPLGLFRPPRMLAAIIA
jgi:hypothetical protein